jgi:hypothetical protein
MDPPWAMWPPAPLFLHGSITANLDTGRGHSVLEVLHAYGRDAAVRFRSSIARAPTAMSPRVMPCRPARTSWAGRPTRDLDAHVRRQLA